MIILFEKGFGVDKKEARKAYDRIVEDNIRKKLKDYEDPDIPYEDIMKIKNNEWYICEEVGIRMSSDGLCSIKKMQLICKDDADLLLEKYVLLRKGMFDCLKRPLYVLSINTLRVNEKFS